MAGIAALATVAQPRLAHAGNMDAFYLSGEAALRGGAVVASTTTGGSIWYNPAGLSRLQGGRLDVNVSGYAVRFGARANFESSLPNTVETPLYLLDLNVVPAAVTLTRRFGDVGVGVGVFVPSQSGVDLRTKLESGPDDQGRTLEFGYDTTSDSLEYHVGPGIGWDALDVLSLGASVLINYRTREELTSIAATLESPDDKISWSEHHTLDSQGAGLEMVLGTQWSFAPGWSLGFVMRTPSLRLGQAKHQVDTRLVANSAGDILDEINFEKEFGLKANFLSPFRFHLGLSYDYRRWSLSAEASVLTAFENEVLSTTERTTVNGRIGAYRRLNEFWSVGGGLFSDRSPVAVASNLQQGRIDYYGATIAVEWLRSFGVYSEGRHVLEEPRAFVFGTTVAFSYALGLGEMVGARVGPAEGGGILLEDVNSDVTAHELTLHIGSTLGE